MNADEADAFRPGAQLAAELLTGQLLVENFDFLAHTAQVLNEHDPQQALNVAILALHEAVLAHTRLLGEQPPPDGVPGYLVRQGEHLAEVLRYLDEPDPGLTFEDLGW